MKYKSTDYMYQVTNPIITENIQKSMREKIFHYTNLDALLSILKNKYLKFNRIDNVNDQTEKLFINDQEIINQVFLSCFTHRKSEYIPHWFMYSRDVYGVRLAIYKKADCLTTDCLIDYDKPVLAFKNGEKIDELAAIRNSTEFYSKLNIDLIDVTCGPWMTETLKEVVKDICSTYLGGIKFEVRNSRFDKIIRR